jgi:hypothetical protein
MPVTVSTHDYSRRILTFTVGLLLVRVAARANAVGATEIVVTHDPLWTPTFDVVQLDGLPGTDFTTTQTSAANQALIDVSRLATLTKSWVVYAGKTDITWPAGLTLWIRRTRNGTALGGSIDAGSLNVWPQIVAANTELFRGQRVRYDVPAQLEVHGLTVLMNAGTYTTTVTFTVTEL